MPIIDLNRLIIRKSYFIPIKLEALKNAIFKELNSSDPPIFDHYRWNISEEHERCWTFEVNIRFMFIREQTLGKKNKKLVKKLANQFDSDVHKYYFETLSKLFGHKADLIYVYVTKTESNGCYVDVECLPCLYRQIQQVEKKAEEYQIQDAYLACERFTKYIFEGGLSGTLMSEEKRKIPQIEPVLLFNNSSIRQITEKIQEMIENATSEILILGWVGTYVINKLEEVKKKGVNIRAITHKPKELKDRTVLNEISKGYKEIIRIAGLDCVSIRPDLHGRALIVDSKAIIGSMDLNSQSLSGSHIEFGIYTEDPELIRQLRKYFNHLFTPLKSQ